MVDRFPFNEVPTEQLFSNEDVLENIRTPNGPRMTRSAHHHIASFVTRPPSFPISIGISRLGPTTSTGCRLRLFAFPQAHTSLARQAGHRRCRLDGRKVLPHSLQRRSRMPTRYLADVMTIRKSGGSSLSRVSLICHLTRSSKVRRASAGFENIPVTSTELRRIIFANSSLPAGLITGEVRHAAAPDLTCRMVRPTQARPSTVARSS